MRRILLPVMCDTWAMPYESRRSTPICDGVRPFLASLVTCSRTSAGEVFEVSHDGGVRRYGSADLEIPFLRGARGPAAGAGSAAATAAGLDGARVSDAIDGARGAPLAVHTTHGD